MSSYVVFGPLLFGLGLVFIFISRRLRKGSNSNISVMEDLQVLEIKVPRVDEDEGHSPQSSSLLAENMFASLHGLLRDDGDNQEFFAFEVVSHGEGGIHFYVTVPRRVGKFVESQIYAQYSKALIKEVPDYCENISSSGSYSLVNLALSKEDFFPLKSFRDLEVDPLSGITSVLSHTKNNELVGVQIVAKPRPDNWQADGYKYTKAVRDGVSTKRMKITDEVSSIFASLLSEIGSIIVGILTDFFKEPEASTQSHKPLNPPAVRLSPTQDLELKSVENKLSKLGYQVQIRILAASADEVIAENNMRSVIASMKQFYTATTNGFVSKSYSGGKEKELDNYCARILDESRSFTLNTEELAAVFHLPSAAISTPNMSAWVYSKKSEPPAELPTKDCTYIGETIYRDKKIRFGINNGDDRLRHMYLIGKSGTGKSTLLETMASQDIANGYGVGLLDPHGETIDHLLERIPDNRMDDVVIVDPSDINNPVGINLLELDDPEQKNLMASALVAAIKHHFDYSWGPRLEYLLNYALLTLLEAPQTTMLGITRLLEDQNYLNYVLHYVEDPVIRKFWDTEYKAMKGNTKLVTEAIAPIQNKVNRFLASSTVRNILGQQKSTVDIWDIMNSGKILLMNLSKGKIGEDNANLLGALLVSRIQFMALQRAKIPSDQRRPFYLYVDEFQNFATGSFESILSESRKYKLGLYLTHQYTAQLPDELLQAVLGNVGTIASFSLGAPDAKVMSNEFAPFFDQQDLISMERFNIYIKLMIDGMTSMPFSARILVPWEEGSEIVPKSGNKEATLELSRQKYGVSVDLVKTEINKWTETQFDKGKAIVDSGKGASRSDSGVKDGSGVVTNEALSVKSSGEINLQDVSAFTVG
ncbi:MAG TPA: ATP-binding protein, partial [candidate division WWE3 bacterium]|nr:ATP-binding protein [candidate division WWE3 bacterium]